MGGPPPLATCVHHYSLRVAHDTIDRSILGVVLLQIWHAGKIPAEKRMNWWSWFFWGGEEGGLMGTSVHTLLYRTYPRVPSVPCTKTYTVEDPYPMSIL